MQGKGKRERRKSRRLQRGERVLVKIAGSGEQPSLSGEVARCSTHDISGDGVRLEFSDPVPVGSKLDLRINVHDRPGTFILAGRVVWCREVGSHRTAYAVGVEFEPEGSDDLDAWRAMLGVSDAGENAAGRG